MAARPGTRSFQNCCIDMTSATRVADLPGLRSLRSVGTNRLVVPPVKLSTVGSRVFPLVRPQILNDLPEDVTSAESLSTFRRRLKTHLFMKSFPDCFPDINYPSLVDLALAVVCTTLAILNILNE